MRKVLCIVSLLLLTITAFARVSGDFEYKVENGNATITDYLGSEAHLTIPDKLDGYTVTTIGKSAFYDCDSLETVIIPNSVTTIDEKGFYTCRSLESVTIPDSVATIGFMAFEYCYNLVSVTIPDSVTTIGSRAFYDCDSLESITIPDSVTGIGYAVFRHCDSLESVIIGDSVTSIKGEAFRDCTSLESVTIGDSLTFIGEYAFLNCPSLTKIEVSDENPAYSFIDGVLFDKKGTVLHTYLTANTRSSYTIPENVTSIGDYAFYRCRSLESVVIPDSVTFIGESAFALCSSLENIEVSNSSPAYSFIDGVLFNKKGSVLHTYLTANTRSSYTIPDGTIIIADQAFRRSNSLIHVIIPNSVTTIGTMAFDECDNLVSVTIPRSVDSIGHNAFYECPKLVVRIYKDSYTHANAGDRLYGVNYEVITERPLHHDINYVYRTIDNLRVRNAGGLAGKSLFSLPKGTPVIVIARGAQEIIDNFTANWLQVEVAENSVDTKGNRVAKGTTGWLYGGYVSTTSEGVVEGVVEEVVEKVVDVVENNPFIIPEEKGFVLSSDFVDAFAYISFLILLAISLIAGCLKWQYIFLLASTILLLGVHTLAFILTDYFIDLSFLLYPSVIIGCVTVVYALGRLGRRIVIKVKTKKKSKE